jgi:hypothetical protein
MSRKRNTQRHTCKAVQTGSGFECSECGKRMSFAEEPSAVLDSAAQAIERGRKQNI